MTFEFHQLLWLALAAFIVGFCFTAGSWCWTKLVTR